MLRRNSSNRLGRRKSTSSAHSKHDSIDPEVARHHAQTAATLAFNRAQERSSADMGNRGGGVSRSNTTASYQGQHLSQAGQAATNVVRRQNSVRFAGPAEVQRRRSVDSRAVKNTVLHNPTLPKLSSASLRPVALTTNDPVPAAYRPPSRSSSIGKASTGKAAADGYVTALAAYNEYYTREDDVASTPSSYRRIRKSKSMFSPLKAPNVFYTNGTPDRPVSGYRSGEQSIATSRTPQVDPPAAALRAPKSMSFLRGGRDHLTPSLRGERNDEAVQMARDRFFHQLSQQRLREQPSFLFRSKAQRQEKPFRQSVRTSSTNSYGNPIASANQVEQPKESGLKEKARRVSKSLKNRLKRAFGRTKDEPVEIPNQQVSVLETHVRRYPGDPSIVSNSFEDIPHPNQTTLQRVASRPPSIHPANSSQQLRSYAGSVKSNKSDHSDDRSRVTSWTSTAANTITSHGARLQSERDLQRLSVINENGTHMPSSSFNRQKLSNQFSAYPIIQKPGKSVGQVPALGPGSVDSARVYSALMKRLDENSPKAKLEAAKMASRESLNTTPKCVPARNSSVRSSNRSPATIRQVPQSNHSSDVGESVDHDHHWVRADSVHSARAEDVFGYTGIHTHQWVPADPLREARMRDQDDVFSPKSVSNTKGNSTENKENIPMFQNRGRSGSVATQETDIRTSYHTVPEEFGLTPQELASFNEPHVQRPKTIREAKSIFFGGTGITLTRTASPFRRALAETHNNATTLSGGVTASVNDFPLPSAMFNPPRRIFVVEDGPNEAEKAYSESVYSRTTSGNGPGATNSALSLPMLENEAPEMAFQNTGTGDVIILDRATYRPAMPGPEGHRATSSAGSMEWKKWMSSEVAKLERARDYNPTGSFVNYALPTMPKSFHAGHVRESAQINDDETDIAPRKVSAVKQPLGPIIQQHASTQNSQQLGLQNPPLLKPILKNRSAVSLVENIDSSTTTQPSIPIPPPPPIPPRSPLRPIQSRSSLRSVATANTSNTASAPTSAVKVSSLNGRNLLHKRNTSQATLRSTKSLDTPAKLVKRSIRKVSNTASAPSPGGSLTATVERQFGSTSTRSATPGVAWSANRENVTPQTPLRDEIYGSDGAGLMGPVMSGGGGGGSGMQELDAQQMGSKRMVDLFLSSRRRRIAGGSEEDGAGGVFI